MLRLSGDASLHGDITRDLRRNRPELDFVRVQEVGLRTAADQDILEVAARVGRLVVTQDLDTMINFAYDRVRSGLAMPGLLVVRQDVSIGQAIEAVLLLAVCSEEDEWDDQVVFLPL